MIWISYKCPIWSIFGPWLCLKFANTLFTHICREFEKWCNLRVLSGKFLRQKSCYPESFHFFLTLHRGKKQSEEGARRKGQRKDKKTERTSKEKKETWHRCLVSISPDLLCSHCPSTCHQNTQQEQNKKNITLSIYLKMEPRTYQNKTDNTR